MFFDSKLTVDEYLEIINKDLIDLPNYRLSEVKRIS